MLELCQIVLRDELEEIQLMQALPLCELLEQQRIHHIVMLMEVQVELVVMETMQAELRELREQQQEVRCIMLCILYTMYLRIEQIQPLPLMFDSLVQVLCISDQLEVEDEGEEIETVHQIDEQVVEEEVLVV